MNGRKDIKKERLQGSALILTVVLTSILAIVGVMFLMASRVEMLSTSSMTDERDLNLAVDTIVSKLANELVLDVPGVAGQEYYDYPGEGDRWLACIEPYYDADVNAYPYRWSQITDLTGYLEREFLSSAIERVRVEAQKANGSYVNTLPEYRVIELDRDGDLLEQSADADGDGIADSKWFELEDLTTSKAESIYAAIRVIDNAGMLNINSAYEPDETDVSGRRCDGSRLHQVNLNALPRLTNTIFEISRTRSGITNPTGNQLDDYERYGVWRLTDPCDDYSLFDISDELELRFRNIVSSPGITRIETTWEDTVSEEWTWVADRPYDGRFNWGLTEWRKRNMYPYDPNQDRRHMLTTYNLDRIIANDANGLSDAGMINVNFDPDILDQNDNDYNELDSWRIARDFYTRCVKCLEPNLPLGTQRRMKRELAQLAVNMVDLKDVDNDVTSLSLPYIEPNEFIADEFVYGMEPFPVITRVAFRIDPNDPCNNPNFYAVELFNPFDQNIPLDDLVYDFRLCVTDFNETVDPNNPNASQAMVLADFVLPGPGGPATLRPDDYLVLYNESFFNMDPTVAFQFPALTLSKGYRRVKNPVPFLPDVVDPNFVNPHNINIKRAVRARYDPNNTDDRYIYVDRQLIYRDWVRWDPNGESRFYGRPYNIETAAWWDVVYPQSVRESGDPNNPDPNVPATALDIWLGMHGYYGDMANRPSIDIAIPYGLTESLRTIGDIARIWTIGPTDRLYDPCDAENPVLSEVYDPNILDVPDPNDPNDPNGRFAKFEVYSRTVGEKLRFVSLSVGTTGNDADEDLIRLNLADPLYTKLFQYITVFDPRVDKIDNDGDRIGWLSQFDYDELKIPGRINVNTAPAHVIAQLPWMTEDIARAIVDYRDKLGDYDDPNRYDGIRFDLSREMMVYLRSDYVREYPGFASIGELNLIAGGYGDPNSIWKYALEAGPGSAFPDLTDAYGFDDEAYDDFEERDLIFSRISNLVTVRSDVFTAYILVRLGTDGPQKRMVAILDRTDVYQGGDKVKIIALHPLPYPK